MDVDCACPNSAVFVNIGVVSDGFYLCMGKLDGFPNKPRPTPRQSEIACFAPEPYESLPPQQFRDGIFNAVYGAAFVYLNAYEDSIDPYVAIKNNLPLETPLAFFAKNSF